MELPTEGELCVIQGDSLGQGTNDLMAVEEDLAKLQFYSNQDPRDLAVNWFDYEESTEATGWLDDQPDVVEEFQPQQGLAGARMSVTAGRVEEQSAAPKSAGVKNFARDWSISSTGIIKQSAA